MNRILFEQSSNFEDIMQASIKISPAELTAEFFERIKSFIGAAEGYEIEVRVTNKNDASFYKKLDISIQEAKEGKIVRFTPDELDEYTNSKLG